jgi:hypothetical protein
MKQLTPSQLENKVAIFNRRFPVGTGVGYSRRIGEPPAVRTRVIQPAFVLSGHSAVTFIEHSSAVVAVDSLSAVQE